MPAPRRLSRARRRQPITPTRCASSSTRSGSTASRCSAIRSAACSPPISPRAIPTASPPSRCCRPRSAIASRQALPCPRRCRRASTKSPRSARKPSPKSAPPGSCTRRSASRRCSPPCARRWPRSTRPVTCRPCARSAPAISSPTQPASPRPRWSRSAPRTSSRRRPMRASLMPRSRTRPATTKSPTPVTRCRRSSRTRWPRLLVQLVEPSHV